VVARARPPAPEVVLADRNAVVRVRRLPGLVRPALLGSHREAHRRAAQTLAGLYGATAAVTGASVLVDSSKDPLYGLLLAAVPGVRVHVVHLVRDSRAVAWSWQRTRRRPEIEGRDAFLPVHSALHTALEWDLRNALAHVLGARAGSYQRVTYETLVRDPDAVVAAIALAAGAGAHRPAGPGEVVNHTVGGNPMRFGGDRLTVKPDEEWRGCLSTRDRRLVTALTAPLLRVYGYR
jgi:hypothetical protein